MLERYNPILNAIKKQLCSTAHIGGGAVRDSLLERPIKDIDLFLNAGATDKAAVLLRSDFGFVKVGEWKSYEMFSDPAVAQVAKFEKGDESIPVWLIGLNLETFEEPFEMWSNLRRFDFGICMAGWDGDKVYTADEYKTDLEQKTFTLCRADNWQQFAYSMSRFAKMTADRYSGWKLAVPDKFKKLAQAQEHVLKKTHYYDDDLDAWKLRDFGAQMPSSPKAR